ncbi:Glycosyltransferase involved in cell wall bisynthesis [Evansella caseinilytica]|uniref:Glycosyltransferase involved in cell wall bisynthesis n=1 Tax=Evansella caseinilytica TaxID=1503961 RepID=A0A1H3GZI6_9BACI|nr:glycosyltransferase family 4 protein [Evansella caseinilytica]SDY08048.1 Glycosyltransferase involved in cell wall bisynthesis [Evansella caseinilytica]
MKLAFICTESLPSPAVRGGAIQMMIDGVSPFLSKLYELTIFSVTDPELPDVEIRDDVEYIRFPSKHYKEQVISKLQSEHYDIIHVFNRPQNIPFYRAASPGSKIILGLHNEMLSDQKISFISGKEVIRSVDGIVTVSEYLKQTVIRRFSEASPKTTVVYSGVSLHEYPPVWTSAGRQIRTKYRKKYNIEGKKVILFVGRLTRKKGPHLLISAFQAIVKRHPDTVLVVAGGKWFSDDGINQYIRYLKRLADPVKEHVLFTKYIPAHEIPNIFLMSDIFVCTSQWQEPLARVHYEAFAAGIPVITTNRGGNSEVILHKETGYLIEDYNKTAEFAKAVHYYLKHPDTAALMAKKGREFVEGNFQFQHVAARLEAVYSKITEASL